MTMECEKLSGELSDRVFLTCILLKKSSANTQAAATTFQRLSKAFQKSIAIDKNPLLLSSYTQGFKFVFAKKEFDILSEHHWQDYTIELILGLELKLSKVYSLSNMKQTELDTFLSQKISKLTVSALLSHL